MKISVIGCGRWGSFIAWYLDRQNHNVTLYGRENSKHMKRLLTDKRNDLLEIRDSLSLSTDLDCIVNADIIVISIGSQELRSLMMELNRFDLNNKIIVLCMKGLEILTGKRLSEVAYEYTNDSIRLAVWLGPGHVQEYINGIPNCMVIDSMFSETKELLVREFTGDLIRFYYGQDLIGNELGAAAKNVIGIAAGMLDGLKLSPLKGALMSRGTREIARLISKMGGNELSAYGLCHLGDYEATVFSEFSHNRRFGEAFVKKETFTDLAEGFYTVKALVELELKYDVELPICHAIYDVLYHGSDVKAALDGLFTRTLKNEF